MPELSVILPARNAEDTIARAVSSTLAAMSADAELIVADDGSTDDTSHALEAVQADGRMAHTVVITLSRNFGKEP